MWRIEKGAPPPELEEWKEKYWDRLEEMRWGDILARVRRAIKRQLWEEQRGLCCYCQIELQRPGELEERWWEEKWEEIFKERGREELSTIEHFKPQALFPELRFEYRNLFLCCSGGENRQGGKRGWAQRRENKNLAHCGKRKGAQLLVEVDLLGDPPIEERLCYKIGEVGVKIYCCNRDEVELMEEIEKVLNLNSPRLQKARREVLEIFLQELGRRLDKKGEMFLKKVEEILVTSTPAPPFAGMLLYFLREFFLKGERLGEGEKSCPGSRGRLRGGEEKGGRVNFGKREEEKKG
jgi:uncharacterized protein (TIGR02646 family)